MSMRNIKFLQAQVHEGDIYRKYKGGILSEKFCRSTYAFARATRKINRKDGRYHTPREIEITTLSQADGTSVGLIESMRYNSSCVERTFVL